MLLKVQEEEAALTAYEDALMRNYRTQHNLALEEEIKQEVGYMIISFVFILYNNNNKEFKVLYRFVKILRNIFFCMERNAMFLT